MQVKLFAVFVVLYLLMEALYFTFTKDMYHVNFAKVTQRPVKEIAKFISIGLTVSVTYILLIAIIWHFVMRDVVTRKTTIMKSLTNAAVLGLAMYGIYNLTNFATLPKYSLKIAVMDTLWGVGSLCILTIIMDLFS